MMKKIRIVKNRIPGIFSLEKVLGILALYFSPFLFSQIYVSDGATLYIGNDAEMVTVRSASADGKVKAERIIYSCEGNVRISENPARYTVFDKQPHRNERGNIIAAAKQLKLDTERNAGKTAENSKAKHKMEDPAVSLQQSNTDDAWFLSAPNRKVSFTAPETYRLSAGRMVGSYFFAAYVPQKNNELFFTTSEGLKGRIFRSALSVRPPPQS